MISEKTFAKEYKSFWAEHTPWLFDYCNSAMGRGSRFSKAIDLPEKSNHVSINNIIATTHFRNMTHNTEYSVDQSFRDSIPVLRIFSLGALEKYELTEDYREIILIQAERLASQYSGNLVHDPIFPGCGIMTNCAGDLLYGTTLVEIKARSERKGRNHNKPFDPEDFRQLLVYCALNYLANDLYEIQRIHLFNPRLGYFWQSGVEEFIYRISNSTSLSLFENIGNYLSSLSELPDMDRGFYNTDF